MGFKQICKVDETYYTSNIAMGGNGGYGFYIGMEEGQPPQTGAVVCSLKAWCISDCVRGLEVELTDGSSRMFGKHDGTASIIFKLARGEKITSLKIWAANHRNGRSGGFELTTDQKRTFNVNSNRTGRPYQPELGSGILVGMFGKSGHSIDCLGFGLLRRVEKAQLINVEYPDLNTSITTTSNEIKSKTYDNSKGTAAQEHALAGTEMVETSESWSETAGMEYAVETEVKASIPTLTEAQEEVSVTVGDTGSHGRSNEHTELTYKIPLSVPAGKCMRATATLFEGDIDTDYKGEMFYKLDSGKTFTYDVTGTYKGVSACVTMAAEPF